MTVKFFATYRGLTGCARTELEAQPDVLSLLHALKQRYPALGEKVLSADGRALGADAILLVNGRHIEHLNGVATPLAPEDTVAVFPLVAGG